jgi:hypothetical protein
MMLRKELFQKRHGHEQFQGRIVPKYNAVPFLVDETFERRADLTQVAHSLVSCRANRVDVERRHAERPGRSTASSASAKTLNNVTILYLPYSVSVQIADTPCPAASMNSCPSLRNGTLI